MLRRKRRNRVVVSCVFFAVFLFILVVAVLFEADPAEHWSPGELPGVLAVLAVLLALGAIWARLAWTLNRRIKRTAALSRVRQTWWLPPESAHDYTEDQDDQIPRLRTLGRRIIWSTLAWLCVLLAAGGGFVLLAQRGQDLLDRGVRTTATVTGVLDSSRWLDPSIRVRFRYPSEATQERVARIFQNSEADYSAGQVVTVVLDPADPSRVRTLDERNDNQLLKNATWALLVIGCIGLPVAFVTGSRWRKRYLAVRATGWRAAKVDISQLRGKQPVIIAWFRDGSELDLLGDNVLRTPTKVGEFTDVSVLLGGTDQHMVMLMRRLDDPRKRVYPVKATARRIHLVEPETKRDRVNRRARGRQVVSLASARRNSSPGARPSSAPSR